MPFKMKYTNGSFPYKGESHSFVHKGGYKVIKKDLDDGILGEANNDGTIYVDKDIPSGSAKEKEVIKHEVVHQEDMKKGDLGYTDNDVTWKGKKYARKNGKINYKGKWMEEGDHSLPWEKKAHNA
jgi:GTP-dependent phosphoenolpyruvate carboxykinase